MPGNWLLPHRNVKYVPLALVLGNEQKLKMPKVSIGKGLKKVGKIIHNGGTFDSTGTCGHVENRNGI